MIKFLFYIFIILFILIFTIPLKYATFFIFYSFGLFLTDKNKLVIKKVLV